MFKAEDDKQKERISSKNGLESYCFNMKSTLEDEKLKDKISDDDRKTINDKCDETIKWLDANQTAEMDEYADKQKEIGGVCNPIITKLYQAAGGAPWHARRNAWRYARWHARSSWCRRCRSRRRIRLRTHHRGGRLNFRTIIC